MLKNCFLKCHVPPSKRYRRAYNAKMAAGSFYETIAHAWIGTSWHRITRMYHEKDLSTSVSLRTKTHEIDGNEKNCT